MALIISSLSLDRLITSTTTTILYSFVVHLLEQGKQLYDVGVDKQLCLLLDRGGSIKRNGSRKVEKMDMSVIPNLVELFRHLTHVLLVRGADMTIYLSGNVMVVVMSWLCYCRICCGIYRKFDVMDVI